MNSKLLGFILVLASALAYSWKAIFIKLAYAYPVDAITLLTLRMLFASPFYVLALILTKKNATAQQIPSGKRLYQIIFVSILGFYLSSILDFEGLKYIDASLERIILFSYPTLVVVFSAILFKAVITKNQVAALCITFTGLMFTFYGELDSNQINLIRGSAFVFGAAITFALYYLGSSRLIPVFGPIRFTAYALLIATLITTTHFLIIHPLDVLAQPWPVLGWSACMAVVSTVLPTFLLSSGMHRIGPQTSSIISTIGPISTIFIASILLGEVLIIQQIIGAILVVIGVITVGLKGRARKVAPE